MAELFLIGINHFDPFGRKKLTATLQYIKEQGYLVDAIAVEWASDTASTVIAQRPIFAKLVAVKYPKTKQSDIITLTETLAYEADTHIALYPNTSIIWLDEQRVIKHEDVEKYAQSRLSLYSSYTYQDSSSLDLEQLSNTLLMVASSTSSPSERDSCWFNIVANKIKDGYKTIICIVGSTHINITEPDFFGSRLSNTDNTLHIYDTTSRTNDIGFEN
jgi:hypothetical protein